MKKEAMDESEDEKIRRGMIVTGKHILLAI